MCRTAIRFAFVAIVSGVYLLAPPAMAQSTGTGNGVPNAKPPADVAGTWEGSLDVGAIRLKLVFHIRRDGNRLQATMDSPDQGAKGIPLDEVILNDTQVTIAAKKMNAKFAGALSPDRNELNGRWIQGGREFPLKLARVSEATKRLRPQTPKAPFPYQSEDVTYSHTTGKFSLAGTLTIPHGPGPFPAAILISGSGPQDRDESIFEHKPFGVLADYLTRQGLVVLRVDDRGIGGTGVDDNPSDDTSADFVTDVKSAIAYLKSRHEVDSNRLGLIGHSEGALVGSLVAAENRQIAFLVLLAGPGVPGDELLYVQAAKIARASGASEEVLAKNKAAQEKLFGIIRNQPDISKGREEARQYLRARFAELSDEEKKSVGTEEAFTEQQSAVIAVPWFRFFLTFDPRSTLKQVTCPVLALTGEKDLQVAPEQNLPEIERAVKAGGNKDVTVATMPGLNHLLQTAKTGLVTEYGELEETMAPAALQQIADWLRTHKVIP